VVLNFWASSCTPCILEMPAFERAHRSAGDDVTFIGLAVTDPESLARDRAEQTGVTYELGFDPTGEIIRQFGSTTLPTTVFIDADGTIVATSAGELDDAEIRDGIRTHLGIEVPSGP
jgi:thiol-disulfide isomerase/thioredoxin